MFSIPIWTGRLSIVVEIQTDLRALWEGWENRGQVQLRDIHRFAVITITMEEQRCFLNIARNKPFMLS